MPAPLVSRHSNARRHRLALYFAVMFGISWLFWIPAAYFSPDVNRAPGSLLLLAGSLASAAGGLLVGYFLVDEAGRRDYLKRLTDRRRIGRAWWAVIALLPLAQSMIAIAWGTANGTTPPDLAVLKQLLAQPWQIIPFAAGLLLFAALPQEIGWRGVALPQLLRERGAWRSGILLGLLWIVWQFPLFLIEGTYQNAEMPPGSLQFWAWVFSMIALSVLITWVFEGTQRSTLGAILFHFSVGFWGALLDLPPGLESRRGLVIVLSALAVIALATALPKRATVEASLPSPIGAATHGAAPPLRREG